MVRRPRMEDELFELFEDKKQNDKENIGDVILREFPEIEEELQEKEQVFEENSEELFEGGLLD